MSDTTNVVEVAETTNVKRRGSHPFTFTDDRLVKVLNTNDQSQVDELNQMSLKMAYGIAFENSIAYRRKFVNLLAETGIIELGETVIGLNRHTVTTYGTDSVVETEIKTVEEKREYVALWFKEYGNIIRENLDAWTNEIVMFTYDNLVRLEKLSVNKLKYRLHRIVITGIFSVKTKDGEKDIEDTKILYRVENSGDNAYYIVQSALQYLREYHGYVYRNDDGEIGANPPK